MVRVLKRIAIVGAILLAPIGIGGCIVLTLPVMVADGDPYGGSSDTALLDDMAGRMNCDKLAELERDIRSRPATLAQVRAAKLARLAIIAREKAEKSCEE